MSVNFGVSFRLLLTAVVFFGLSTNAHTQSDPEAIRIDFGKRYQLQDSYAILYDNTSATAKLKDFRVTFYDPDGRVLLETNTETHLLMSKNETYSLEVPVTGFSEVGLFVLSLHSGEIEDFPTDIGAILGLSEMTEVPEPVILEDEPVDTPPPPPVIPSLTEAEKARLSETASILDALLSDISEKLEDFERENLTRAPKLGQVNQLIEESSLLSNQANARELTDLKLQIDALAQEISTARNAADFDDQLTDLRHIKADLVAIQPDFDALQVLSESEGADVSNVMSSLAILEDKLDGIGRDIAGIQLPDGISEIQIETWKSTLLSYETQVNAPLLDWRLLLVIALALLALIIWLAKLLLSGTAKTRSLKAVLNNTQSTGVVFPGSPMLAGNVAAPLSASGQLTAAQLQMLTGPYAILRDAYQATGRIGYAQEGAPTAEDYSFGTGFLISDRHVITNRHVHGLYGHYLMDDADPGGIEFIAEKEKDASDFVPFKNEPPLLLPSLDIAIYTLAKPVTNRKPIQLAPIQTDVLDGREVVVIGYPDTHTPEAEDIRAAVEDNAIFAVKRISQGQIFRHSTDTDTPYGVETHVSEDKDTAFAMPAICHNASTLSGNSGSPLLDIKTGELLGVHFAGFKAFNKKEAANLAMAIAQLTNEATQKHLPTVTEITG